MRFNASAPTIGAEYELQILNADTLDLADEVEALMRASADRAHLTKEYFQPTIEIVSRVCQDVPELERHLLEQVAMLERAAAAEGLKLAGGGVHPFSTRQVGVSPSRRYRKVRKINGEVSLLQVTYGLHVHVGCESGDQAIHVMNRLRPYLPLLLALSANSPYWRALDSGFASYRQRMLMTMHAFGLPPRFQDWAAFERMAEVSRRAGVFTGLKDMHWDLRPHPDFGTLEVRVMDAQSAVADTAALAAVVQCLAAHLKEAEADRLHIRELPRWIEEENHYRAALRGMHARCIVDTAGSVRPMQDLAAAVLEDLRPLAERLGCAEQLERARRRAAAGEHPGHEQRRLLEERGSLEEVVGVLADRLAQESRQVH